MQRMKIMQIITYFLVEYKECDAKPNHIPKFSFNWTFVVKQDNTFSYGLKVLYNDVKINLNFNAHTKSNTSKIGYWESNKECITSSNIITNNKFQKQSTCIVTQKQSLSLKLVYFTKVRRNKAKRE
jgi:hypothetical protein